MYIHVKDTGVQYPYSIAQLRIDNPDTSFPNELSEERLAEWSVYPVIQTEAPQYDPATEVLEQLTASYNQEHHRWETVWNVRPHTEEETLNKSAEVRAERNSRIASCDWTQVLDAQVDRAAWAVYRQALRDVPQQPGFPWSVEWPQPPQ